MNRHRSPRAPDVVVIGGGLIGLACAAAAAERGVSVQLLDVRTRGEASIAAAGLLAPSIERGNGSSQLFAFAARDRYPSYIDWLRDRTGIDVPMSRRGVIQLAVNEAGVRGLTRTMAEGARWLDAGELSEIEPALAHGLGGVLHEQDGWVDNVILARALRRLVDDHSRVSVVEERAVALRGVPNPAAVGASGTLYEAGCVVLAAGAWSTSIAGLPRRLAVEPVRGQMLAFGSAVLSRAVYGPTGYVVPRSDGRTLVGATMERVGFDATTTESGIDRLRRTAGEVLPQLADMTPSEVWAGLRPMSPDGQPIIGPDPEAPWLLYATAHSRNGVLMTPLTGDCVAALVASEAPPADLTAFAPARFK